MNIGSSLSQAGAWVADRFTSPAAKADRARDDAEAEYYRTVTSSIGQMTATHAGTVPGRLDTPWWPGAGYSHYVGNVLVHDSYEAAAHRARSQSLERSNPLATGVLDRACENVVGTTIRVEPRTEDPEFNRQAKAWWKQWAYTTSCDARGIYNFGGMLRLLHRGKLRDGDCGILLAELPTAPGAPGRPVLQLIEADQFETPPADMGKIRDDGSQIVDGIELNESGRAVAYHLRYVDVRREARHQRIEAKDFIYLRRSNRYRAVRGETAFYGMYTLFDQIMGVLDATVVSWRVGAMQAMIAKKNKPAVALAQQPLMRTIAAGTPSVVTQERWQPIQPGMINHIGIDEDLVPFNPSQPQQNMPAALDAFCRILGVRFGLTLEQVLLNFSLTSYSSSRAAQRQAESTSSIEQEDLATNGVSRAYQWAISKAVKSGAITARPPRDFWAHEWIPDAKAQVDPQKEIEAAERRVALGIETRSNLAMNAGFDFAELCEQNKKDEELMRANGLDPTIGKKAIPPPAASDEDAPPTGNTTNVDPTRPPR